MQRLQPAPYQKSRWYKAAYTGVTWLALLMQGVGVGYADERINRPIGSVSRAALSASDPPAPEPSAASALTGLPLSVQRPELAIVEAAREANQSKQWSVLATLVPQARHSSLSMYPEYWLLRYQLENLPLNQQLREALQHFLDTYADSYLAARLRGDWVLAAASSGDFATVRSLEPVLAGDAQIECARLEARHMTGQPATAVQARKVFAPGPACWKLFDQLVADQVLDRPVLMSLLRHAIEANRPGEARQFAKYLFDAAPLQAFHALLKDPMKWLAVQPRPPRNLIEQELVTLALASLARKDLTGADAYLRRQGSASLPKENVAWIRSQLALVAALNLDSRANAWYHEAGHVPLTDYNAAWRVRVALRQPHVHWKWVVACIDQMAPSQRAEPVWTYWKARGLQAFGHHDHAREAYASIAHHYNFYGQLAAEELGQAIAVPPQATPVTEIERAQAHAHTGLQRALLLFRLGWRAEAVLEWNFALRGMSDRQLLAAAELARTEHIYDRVINTSERTQHEFDFAQRFIAPFEGRVAAQARQLNLDPAWVYGLIRQESRFIMDARSSAGASGLMQLLPATAKWVANKIGLAHFTYASLNEFDTNTLLGTYYLHTVLQDMNGSEILATAGYNAGPRRSRNWRAALTHPVEGAIFIETIPFSETRRYVKHVMSNAVYYAALFSGQPQSLKARLGRIEPLDNVAVTDLP